MRRQYRVQTTINNIQIDRIIIDPHYETNHRGSIDDQLIIELLKMLYDQYHEPDEMNEPFSYFVTDRIEYEGKFYKLIWLLEQGQNYIGVVNAYRRKHGFSKQR